MSEAETYGEAGSARADTSTPSPARVYDYLLGGKDNYPVDRAVGDQMLAIVPDAGTVARVNRGFLVRAVDAVVRAGVTQFIDLGTGIPTSPNTHDVARAVNPEAKVVYVDNDPLVKAHNTARLQTDGRICTLHADIRDPRAIVEDPAVRRLIDFDRPIALMLVALLHFIPDEENPKGIIDAFRDHMAPGSHLILSHMTNEGDPRAVQAFKEIGRRSSNGVTFRDHDEIVPLFEGFELLEPGLVPAQDWRPDAPAFATGLTVECGVGRIVSPT